ncbi:MAG TPA: hypothetical protein VKY19_16895 [Ktedonosporobacter sp.]|nr:hypothetical protein [Ktedonosporobacter sp.]
MSKFYRIFSPIQAIAQENQSILFTKRQDGEQAPEQGDFAVYIPNCIGHRLLRR